jgi:tetratricopeptide (TPR) repeat protein
MMMRTLFFSNNAFQFCYATCLPLLLSISFFLLFFSSFAQPGDRYYEHRLKDFQSIQDSIRQHPKDPVFKWARIEMLFHPFFDLHTPPTDKLEDYVIRYMDVYRESESDSITVMMRQPCDMCPNVAVRIFNPAKEMLLFLTTHEKELLQDLDHLIQYKYEIKAPWYFGSHYAANLASFLFKRGQFQYVSGKKDLAIVDYLNALEANPSIELKRQIHTSLAAYYYSGEQRSEDNAKQALKYIDRFDENDTRYPKERIELLFSMSDSAFVIDYFQDRSAHALQKYLDLLNKRESKSDSGYEEAKAFDDYKKYEKLILEYLKKNQTQVSLEDVKKQQNQMIEKVK